MKNAIIKFLLQRRFLWIRAENSHFVSYTHMMLGEPIVFVINFDRGIDAVISELINDL